MLDSNPYHWLATRRLSVKIAAWIFIATIVLGGGFLTFLVSRFYDASNVCLGLGIPLAYLMQVGLKVRIGGSAVAQIGEAKEMGALELILSTPLQVTEIIAGQFRAARELFGMQLVSVILLLAAGLCLSFRGLDHLAELFTSPPATAMFRFRAILIVVSISFFLILDSVALTWAGLWFAFRSANLVQARVWSVFWVLPSPFLIQGALVSILVHRPSMHERFLAFYPIGILFLAVTLAIDIALLFYCRNQLMRHARG